jgi:hypothetical protein
VLTPDGGGCGVEKAVGEATRAQPKIAWIFLEEDGKDSVAPEIAVRGIEIRRTEALEVALGPLSESWIGIARLTQTGDKSVGDENEWIDRAFKHQVELLSRRETRHTSGHLDGVEVRHHPHNALAFFLLQHIL